MYIKTNWIQRPVRVTGNGINGDFLVEESRYDSWVPLYRCIYKNGILNGPYIEYHEDHTEEGSYYKGKKHGTIKQYSLYGKLKSSQIYIYGEEMKPINSTKIYFPLEIIKHIIDFYLTPPKTSAVQRSALINGTIKELLVDKAYLKGFHSLLLLSKKINAYMQKYITQFNEPFLVTEENNQGISEIYHTLLNGAKHGLYIKRIEIRQLNHWNTHYLYRDDRSLVTINESRYVSGILHGLSTIYDEKELLYRKGYYFNGKREGIFRVFKFNPKDPFLRHTTIDEVIRYERYEHDILTEITDDIA